MVPLGHNELNLCLERRNLGWRIQPVIYLFRWKWCIAQKGRRCTGSQSTGQRGFVCNWPWWTARWHHRWRLICSLICPLISPLIGPLLCALIRPLVCSLCPSRAAAGQHGRHGHWCPWRNAAGWQRWSLPSWLLSWRQATWQACWDSPTLDTSL